MRTFVYVISGEHGRQKIGSSDNPPQRLKQLQSASPFPLKFEFIGETDNRGGGAVEVQAQWMLRDHKVISGGDEWFVVPPDVAVTAVMAAAHRIGYHIKPVDPDDLNTARFISGSKYPRWVHIAMLPFFGLYLYWIFGIANAPLMSGEMPMGTFAIEAAVLGGLLWLMRFVIRSVGFQFIDLWQDLFAKPRSRESWFKDQPQP